MNGAAKTQRYVLWHVGWLVMVVAALVAQPQAVASKPLNICDRAALSAATEYGVPFKVLAAVARVETGQTISGTFQPWPWTLNLAGRGLRFERRANAEQAIQDVSASGRTNFDIGCFQVNVHWHGESFGRLTDMIDPHENARYAARLLVDHFAITQDWTQAVGRYHSKTADLADAYLEKYTRILAELPSLAAAETPLAAARENTFPLLLRQQGQKRPGSLVPMSTGHPARRLIGDRS